MIQSDLHHRTSRAGCYLCINKDKDISGLANALWSLENTVTIISQIHTKLILKSISIFKLFLAINVPVQNKDLADTR